MKPNELEVAEETYQAICGGRPAEVNCSVANLIELVLKDWESNCSTVRVQIHPLGFLAVRWELGGGKELRLHIWSKDVKISQLPNWPIHDHVFSFRSVVLVGRVQNKLYELVDFAVGRSVVNIFEVHYVDNTSTMVWSGAKAKIKPTRTNIQISGSYYDLPEKILHRSVLRSDFAVTVLATQKNPDNSLNARVIGAGNVFVPQSFNRTTTCLSTVRSLLIKALEQIKL